MMDTLNSVKKNKLIQNGKLNIQNLINPIFIYKIYNMIQAN
jgi:hypothetical protein